MLSYLYSTGEAIDCNLHPILERNIFRRKTDLFIKSTSNIIKYNENFRMYITTKHRNPHYMPETVAFVNVVNFTITERSLQQKLLSTILTQERPDLQDRKEKLIIETTKNRETLYNLETNILEVLSSSEGNILEDENAITVLSNSKIMSEEIIAKQKISASSESQIDLARQKYIPLAEFSSVLYFCLDQLVNINCMYQFSLTWFLNIFIANITETPKHTNLDERLTILKKMLIKSVNLKVCRALYEKDRRTFLFLLCIEILRSQVCICMKFGVFHFCNLNFIIGLEKNQRWRA